MFSRVRAVRSCAGGAERTAACAGERCEAAVRAWGGPALLPEAVEAATAMIMALCGGEAGAVTSAGAEPAWQRTASLRFARLAGLGGVGCRAGTRLAIFWRRLGFVRLRPGCTRRDGAGSVLAERCGGRIGAGTAGRAGCGAGGSAAAGAAVMEPECDLVEEVLRIDGLDRIAGGVAAARRPVPGPALVAGAGPNGAGTAGAGGAWPGGVRDE